MKKIIISIMLALTFVYPLFMTVMAGSGIIYNKSHYGKNLATTGFFLILSGLLITTGIILSLFKKKSLNISSLVFNISGLALCLFCLYVICTHADNSGWRDNYTMTPISRMYKSRILPSVIPSAISATISAIKIKKSRT